MEYLGITCVFLEAGAEDNSLISVGWFLSAQENPLTYLYEKYMLRSATEQGKVKDNSFREQRDLFFLELHLQLHPLIQMEAFSAEAWSPRSQKSFFTCFPLYSLLMLRLLACLCNSWSH